MTEAEGAPEPEEGQADINWDADPVPEGDASIHNVDWDIGVDDIAGLEPAAVTQTGNSLTVCSTFAPACNASTRVHGSLFWSHQDRTARDMHLLPATPSSTGHQLILAESMVHSLSAALRPE